MLIQGKRISHCDLLTFILSVLQLCQTWCRFINERIESLVISARKTDKGSKEASTSSQSRLNASPRILSENTGQFPDPSAKGVELVQLKKDQNIKVTKNQAPENMNGTLLSKDPLLSMDTRSTRSWGSLPDDPSGEGIGVQRHLSGGEWGNALDTFSRRKTEALTPENFDNMWTKGRDYKRNNDIDQLAVPVPRNSLVGKSNSVERSKVLSVQKKNELASTGSCNNGPREANTAMHDNLSNESCREEDLKSAPSDEVESWSSSYTEDDDTSSAMGLDSPGVKVWDGKNKRNFSHIHHPLETFARHNSRKTSKDKLHSKRLHKTKSSKKRSRSSSHNGHVWKEVERTSFLLGDGKDLLNSTKETRKPGDSSEDSEAELLGRICSGAATSSSMSLASLPESQSLAASSAKNSIIADSFFQLRCEVL